MNKSEFTQRLSSIKTAISVTGKRYLSIHVLGDTLKFVRENKTKPESISVSELFELFTKENLINTSIAKSYISGRAQSPAVAILNELKSTGTNYILTEIIPELQAEPIIENKKRNQSKKKK